MSNWSSVILAWSGIDDLVDDGSGRADENRLLAITKDSKEFGGQDSWETHNNLCDWVVAHSCSPQSVGRACEFVATTHSNHFSPAGMMRVLDKYKWEYPESVSVIYKNEDMERHEVVTLEEWRGDESLLY